MTSLTKARMDNVKVHIGFLPVLQFVDSREPYLATLQLPQDHEAAPSLNWLRELMLIQLTPFARLGQTSRIDSQCLEVFGGRTVKIVDDDVYFLELHRADGQGQRDAPVDDA